MNFDWSDLAFGSKKKLNSLDALFIAAPREMSAKRFVQLVQTYLPQGNIVLGLAKEDFIDGFDGQPQFRTLKQKTVQAVIDRTNQANLPHKIYTLDYFQREFPYILQKIAVQKILLVRGSWQHSFHTRPEYYTLVDRGISFEMISPFTNIDEAKAYEHTLSLNLGDWIEKHLTRTLSEAGALDLASKAAKLSFDYSFQTGAILAKKNEQTKKYTFIQGGFNKVVPYQTYALIHGASREENFSPPNDLNHYDTVHAEVMLVLAAQKRQGSLEGTTMFINLLPCPTCSRMLAITDIEEIVYSIDHSDGYAVKMLEAAGKKVRRIVP